MGLLAPDPGTPGLAVGCGCGCFGCCWFVTVYWVLLRPVVTTGDDGVELATTDGEELCGCC